MLDRGQAPSASDRLRAALVALALHAAALALASSLVRAPAAGSGGPGPGFDGSTRLLPPRRGSSRPPEREPAGPVRVRGETARPSFGEKLVAVARRAAPERGEARPESAAAGGTSGPDTRWGSPAPGSEPLAAAETASAAPLARSNLESRPGPWPSPREQLAPDPLERGRRSAETPALDEAAGDSARRAPTSASSVRWLALELEIAAPAPLARPAAPSQYCVPRAPAMPDEALELGLSGEVRARYDVAPDGTVAAVDVDPRAEPVLAEAVRSWLRGCLFEPALRDGRRVPDHGEQTFRFVLVDR